MSAGVRLSTQGQAGWANEALVGMSDIDLAINKLGSTVTPDRPRLLAVGVNNEDKSVVFLAMTPDAPAAISPKQQAADACRGLAREPPPRYVLFPQSELSRLVARPYNLGMVMRIADRRVRVTVDEISPPQHVSNLYRLSASLEPACAEMPDTGHFTAGWNRTALSITPWNRARSAARAWSASGAAPAGTR